MPVRSWEMDLAYEDYRALKIKCPVCLAERGKSCKECGICDGTKNKSVQPVSVVIRAHGAGKKGLRVIG